MGSDEGSPVGRVTNCDLAQAFFRMYLGTDTVRIAAVTLHVEINHLSSNN